MKKLAVLLVLLPACAHAEPIKLTLTQAFGTAQALASLDAGYDKPEKDGKTSKTAYHLGGNIRFKIAHDLRVLNDALSDFRVARDSLRLETPGAEKKDSPEQAKFNDQTEKLAAVRQTFDLETFSQADLNIGDGTEDTNPVPMTSLSLIEPLIVHK